MTSGDTAEQGIGYVDGTNASQDTTRSCCFTVRSSQ